jgi:hypothetical protein
VALGGLEMCNIQFLAGIGPRRVGIAPLKSEPWCRCKDGRRDGRFAPLSAPHCSHGSVQRQSAAQTGQPVNPLCNLRSFLFTRLTSAFLRKLGFD